MGLRLGRTGAPLDRTLRLHLSSFFLLRQCSHLLCCLLARVRHSCVLVHFLMDAQPTDALEQQLYAVASQGDLEQVAAALNQGVAIDWRNLNAASTTPLHIAAQQGHEAVVRLLLGRGASIDATDQEHRTALHTAAQQGHEAVARLLLGHGASIDATDHESRTPLHTAAQQGHEAMVRLLLDRGASIAALDTNNWTPLHSAAQQGHEAVARLLLDQGALIDATDKDADTPLHIAAWYGHKLVVRLLLERGADTTIESVRPQCRSE